MKKLAYIILGFIIGAVLTYYFCSRDTGQNTPDVSIKAPKDTISIAEAKVFSYNWSRNNPTEIDSLIDVEGPRKQMQSVTWTLKNVEDYIAYAKKTSDSLGYDFKGLRIYLGNYGNNPSPIKKNRNTMFIVPTGKKIMSHANSLNIFNFQGGHGDIPISPLNQGTGGNGGYPN